jgi:hypothetical protein
VRFSSFGILSHIVGRDSRRVIIVHLLLFSGINADGWYLDDDKNRGISLTYDGDGYVCEVVIWSGEKETGVDR